MELNPSHPVTAAARDHLHRILLLVMRKLGAREVDINLDELDQANIGPELPTLVLHERKDTLKVLCMDSAREALEYVAQNSGRG